MTRISLVGLGLIGNERLRAVETLQKRGRQIKIESCFDPHNPKLVGGKYLTHKVAANLDEVITARPDLVIVAIPHDVAASTAMTLLSANLKVLIEKPLGRSLHEARLIADCSAGPDRLWTGHNFRFFAGIKALLDDVHQGHFGRPIGLSIVMGHGGRPEDKSSWKLDKERAGGGALIDPGIHLIDLCRIAANSLEFSGGETWRGFWQTGVEEECRLLLRGERIPMIDLTISLVRWRSTFRMEFFGTDGYGIVQGRGRSYGIQRYRRARRWGWKSGLPQDQTEEEVVTTTGDESFADELEALLFGTPNGGAVAVPCSLQESLMNMAVLDMLRNNLGLN